MRHTIPVYSEQDLTPRAMEVIRAVMDDSFPEHTIKFTPWDKARRPVEYDGAVLIFGRAPEGAVISGTRYVYTYSVAQVMAKSNVASVLKAAVQQVIQRQEPVPFDRPMWTTDVEWLFSVLDPTKPTAIDIETSGNLGVTHTPEEVGIISVAFYQAGHPPVVVVCNWDELGSGELRPHQIADLATAMPLFTKAIYHNGKFDTRVLNRILGVKLCVWFDTMLAHHVLNQAAGEHGLKPLARRYLGAPEWEEGLSKYTLKGGHYERIPTTKLVEYNGWDVYWTYKLFEFLEPQIMADEDAEKALTFELQAANFLLSLEKVGIPFDMDYARDFGLEQDSHMASAKHTLRAITNQPEFNPNSPKQVKEWLDNTGYTTDKTNEESIGLVRERATVNNDKHVVDFCDRLMEFRKANKIQGTYIKGWSSKVRDGRVHPTFLVHGTSTGRLSSTAPNAQNVPRDKKIRKLVTIA